MQCTYERLDGLATDYVVRGVALRLNVDPLQAELVLVNDAIHAAVAGAADPARGAISPAVPHSHQNVENRLLQEGRPLLSQPFEQLRGDSALSRSTPCSICSTGSSAA